MLNFIFIFPPLQLLLQSSEPPPRDIIGAFNLSPHHGRWNSFTPDTLKKLDSTVQVQQSAIVENRKALSQIMVDLQCISSKLDSFSVPILVPPRPPHMLHRFARTSVPHTSGPNTFRRPTPPCTFKFSFLCFDDTYPHSGSRSARILQLSHYIGPTTLVHRLLSHGR